MILKCFLGFEERKVLIYSFILSNFNYCPLCKNLQKRGLHFLHNGCRCSFEELSKKSWKSTVNLSHYRSLCIEIFKTLNDINASFVKDIFKLWKRLRYLGPKVLNFFLYHINSSENLTIFKTLIKNWNGPLCTWKICKK